MFNFGKIILTVGSLILFPVLSFSQMSTDELLGQENAITTAVPFLMIAPDSRAGAMGDAGVATTPDINSQHYNPAKYPFIKNNLGISVSYTPWLRALIDDINLLYLSGYKKFKGDQVLSASLLYFSLGNITFTDIVGNTIRDFNPNELSFDFAYSRMYTKKLSGALAFRYIYSNLTGGQDVGGVPSHPGQAVASDISIYYQDQLSLTANQKNKSTYAFGLNISNIGNKISYTENADKDFLPTNLKLGGAFKMEIDDYNTVLFTAEANKLLVPSPPIYWPDSLDPNNNYVVRYGKPSDVGVASGIFQSFWDAPGVQMSADNPNDRSRFREEVREINYSLGAEYWYSKQFALRAGYFHEHPTKGNREFFTLGLGLRLNVFGLDFSYLIPTRQHNPLENTLRFTLSFDFASFGKKEGNEN